MKTKVSTVSVTIVNKYVIVNQSSCAIIILIKSTLYDGEYDIP